jgi:hypothetical protein
VHGTKAYMGRRGRVALIHKLCIRDRWLVASSSSPFIPGERCPVSIKYEAAGRKPVWRLRRRVKIIASPGTEPQISSPQPGQHIEYTIPFRIPRKGKGELVWTLQRTDKFLGPAGHRPSCPQTSLHTASPALLHCYMQTCSLTCRPVWYFVPRTKKKNRVKEFEKRTLRRNVWTKTGNKGRWKLNI